MCIPVNLQIAGGDPITARFLYGEYFEFYPEFKVFWAANHKPIIQGTDHGIWRRIFLIPFNVTIPADEIDRHLSEKLFGELPGIFTWAVRGCLEWQEHGLKPPTEVRAATDEYRDEQDVLGEFISSECIMDPGEFVAKDRLFDTYKKFCDDNGEKPVSKKNFGSRMIEKGFDKNVRRGRKRVWKGIQLKQDAKKKENTDKIIPIRP